MHCDILVYIHIYPNLVLWVSRLMLGFVYLSITCIFLMTRVIRDETNGKLDLVFQLHPKYVQKDEQKSAIKNVVPFRA